MVFGISIYSVISKNALISNQSKIRHRNKNNPIAISPAVFDHLSLMAKTPQSGCIKKSIGASTISPLNAHAIRKTRMPTSVTIPNELPVRFQHKTFAPIQTAIFSRNINPVIILILYLFDTKVNKNINT